MAQLLLTLLGIAVVFVVFVIGGGFLALRWIDFVLTREQTTIDRLLSTGLAPHRWWKRQWNVIELVQWVGAPAAFLRGLKAVLKRRLEYRLAGLIRYLERSNVIPDDHLRGSTAATLRNIGTRWENSTWEEVVGLDDDGE